MVLFVFNFLISHFFVCLLNLCWKCSESRRYCETSWWTVFTGTV